jgi:hypothetical protein
MSEENKSERDKDFRRIDSVNIGTSGHWWNNYDQKNSDQAQEIEPSKLNLNETQDFLLFLKALTTGEKKAVDFLRKIPKDRLEELKKIHSQLEGFFPVLNQ